ncbi:MAG: nucleotide-binding protein [Methanoregulaceae archaeon]|nr:nucleotide-binding protein [Methanoregulaceae archaeon]
MKLVLDASAFFGEMPLDGVLFTSPLILTELRDIRSRGRLEVLRAGGLIVMEPGEESRRRVTAAAKGSGDACVISPADQEILSLALELEACLVTDDFAVQNIARALRIPTRSLLQRKAAFRKWRFRCSGCGRYSRDTGECMVCGSPMKRILK